VITALTGSALLALVLARGVLDEDQVWTAAHVDEDWNIENGHRRRGRGPARRAAGRFQGRGPYSQGAEPAVK